LSALILRTVLLLTLNPLGEVKATEACHSAPGTLSRLSGWLQELQDHDVAQAVEWLKAHGFTCLDSSHDLHSARRCVGRMKGYSKKVAIYIPIHYPVNQNPPTLITHFQGWTYHSSFEETLAAYHLGNELHASGTNKLLIVPESEGKCDTYRNELSSSDQFARFNQEVQNLLRASGLIPEAMPGKEPIQEITGHSGAYFPIGNILRDASLKVRRVSLFDAAYCSSPGLRNSAQTNSITACRGLKDYSDSHPGAVKSYFIEGTTTEKGSRLLFPKEACFPVSKTVGHFDVMTRAYREAIQD